MTYLYGLCAILGGTVMVCQFVMSVLGLGGDHDLHLGDHDAGAHDASAGDMHDHAGHQSTTSLFQVISFRTVVAALAFFGLAGLAANHEQLSSGPTFAIAAAVGVGAMYGVYGLMRSLNTLRSDGTARIERSLGQPATVYVRIPGQRAGVGKIHVLVQNRTLEIAARTAGEALPTGAKVVVNQVLDAETVEVEAQPTGVTT